MGGSVFDAGVPKEISLEVFEFAGTPRQKNLEKYFTFVSEVEEAFILKYGKTLGNAGHHGTNEMSA